MKRVQYLLLCILIGLQAFAQVATEANKQYQTHEGREAIAKTLADPHRDDHQKPRELMDALGLQPGWTVADVGTGVGYMLPFLSRAVGPEGKVIAEDIQTDFLDKAKQRAKLSNTNNVSFILGTTTDAKLPGDSVNAILVLDVYHHFDYPDQMLATLRDSLISGGYLYIVDYYRSEKAMPNGRALEHIRADRDEVMKEVESNGLKFLWTRDHIPESQYILAFQKPRATRK
jgi:ubiquinone/menaquinone biosynthesis C-methylase UbiE